MEKTILNKITELNRIANNSRMNKACRKVYFGKKQIKEFFDLPSNLANPEDIPTRICGFDIISVDREDFLQISCRLNYDDSWMKA